MNPTPRQRLAAFLHRFLAVPSSLATVTSQVDDASGWVAFQGGPNDRDAGEMQQLYTDALQAWRKNPLAKRIVDCITDYVLGDGMTPAAPGQIGRFVQKFWTHPKNHMDRRLPVLNEELARAGDLFVTLHRNPEDGLSYLRPIPKDRITKIETLPNDWETEIAYHESPAPSPSQGEGWGEGRVWLSPFHPNAAEAPAIMLHYSVNSVVGALLGESDLATMIPWLLRYSRFIEDRVRLHWASRAFLWMVTVPPNLVKAKQEQYRTAPTSGSIIVKDDSEKWESVSPDLKGFDAQFDSRSVRQMIDAGSGMPPHWRGEAHDVSLATAQAMEHSASRHLRRRQLYLRFLVQDLSYHAYTRAFQLGKVRAKPNREAITVEITDIDRDDNADLATAAKTIAEALQTLSQILPAQQSPTLRRRILQMVMRFAGEILPEPTITKILDEIPPTGVGAGSPRPLPNKKEG